MMHKVGVIAVEQMTRLRDHRQTSKEGTRQITGLFPTCFVVSISAIEECDERAGVNQNSWDSGTHRTLPCASDWCSSRSGRQSIPGCPARRARRKETSPE